MGFFTATLVGFIVMIVLQPLSIFGPIIGGIVAGSLLNKGAISGMFIGFVAGIFGSIVLVLLLLTLGFFSGLLGNIPIIGALIGGGFGLMTITISLYQAILGAIGGTIGGIISGD